MRPFLDQISRGQIHRYTLWRQGQTDRPEGGTHTFARVGHSLASKTNNRHLWQPVGKMNLHLDAHNVGTTKGDSGDCGFHSLWPYPNGEGHDVGNKPVLQVS